ncbi:hypothetical protein ACTFIZ_012903 [Dictyostelium cf. discoideum]
MMEVPSLKRDKEILKNLPDHLLMALSEKEPLQILVKKWTDQFFTGLKKSISYDNYQELTRLFTDKLNGHCIDFLEKLGTSDIVFVKNNLNKLDFCIKSAADIVYLNRLIPAFNDSKTFNRLSIKIDSKVLTPEAEENRPFQTLGEHLIKKNTNWLYNLELGSAPTRCLIEITNMIKGDAKKASFIKIFDNHHIKSVTINNYSYQSNILRIITRKTSIDLKVEKNSYDEKERDIFRLEQDFLKKDELVERLRELEERNKIAKDNNANLMQDEQSNLCDNLKKEINDTRVELDKIEARNQQNALIQKILNLRAEFNKNTKPEIMRLEKLIRDEESKLIAHAVNIVFARDDIYPPYHNPLNEQPKR